MQFAGVYVYAQPGVNVTTSHELWEITAPTDRSVTILRASVFPGTDATPTDELLEIQIGIVSSSGGGSAQTPRALHPNYGAVGATVTGNSGTVSTLTAGHYFDDGFHVQNGSLYLPVPDERVTVAGSDVVGAIIPTAPGATTSLGWLVVFGVS